MPSDDRERSFENALASHLRAGSSADDLHNACSDAETLSAYHERSLAPQQMASLKTHVADCKRCQQILAHLEATDEIPDAAPDIARPTSAGADSNVRVLHGRKPTLWRWVAPAGALAAALLVWVAVHEDKSARIPAQATRVSMKTSQHESQRKRQESMQSKSRWQRTCPLLSPHWRLHHPSMPHGKKKLLRPVRWALCMPLRHRKLRAPPNHPFNHF